MVRVTDGRGESRYSALAISNGFWDIACASGSQLTHMKIQKLVYIAHGWNLGITGEPLIEDEVMAWKYGPVIDKIWHEFRGFGRAVINRAATVGDYIDGKIKLVEPRIDKTDDWSKTLLEQMWDMYGHMSAIQLSRLTHQPGSPWHTVAQQFNLEPPMNVVIPQELIREHYAEKWKLIQTNKQT